MRLFSTLKRLVRILFIPKREWISIANESESIDLIIKHYAWPFIVVAALIKTGSVFLKFTQEADLFQFRFPFSMTILLFYMIVPLFVLLIGGSLINQYNKSMGATGKKNGALRLLIYSCTPLFLAAIVMNTDSHLPYIQYFGLISIYSVVLFWWGIEPMLHIPAERKLGLMLFAAVVLSFLLFVIMFILRITLNLLYPEDVVLFL